MGEIVNRGIEKYLATIRPPRDEILREMERLAGAREFPIVGPDVGRLLFNLARAIGAKRILELGSGFGYSAFWFAQALPPDGDLHCTDLRRENQRAAENYFQRAGLASKLTFHVGHALEIAGALSGPFDIVFNDIDKEEYPRAIAVALSLLRPGGLFLTDNALWDGKVAEPGPDEPTQAVLRFNDELARHPGFSTVVLPLRDGVSVAVKL
jgi:predicted O-methyltransferase YrrM